MIEWGCCLLLSRTIGRRHVHEQEQLLLPYFLLACACLSANIPPQITAFKTTRVNSGAIITRLVVEQQQHSFLTNPPVVVLALSSSAPHLVANNILYFGAIAASARRRATHATKK